MPTIFGSGQTSDLQVSFRSEGESGADEDLGCVIEGEIIPRLLLAHSSHEGEVQLELPALPVDYGEQAILLSEVVVEKDLEAAATIVQALIDGGSKIEDVFVDVMAHAARHLGRSWERDELNFVDVTIGLSRLQQLLHRYTSETAGYRDISRTKRRALFLPTPGEQHTFGLLMVEDAFRRAGWEVWGGYEISGQGLHDIITNHEVQLIGFSLSGECLLDELTRSIKDIRSSACGDGVSIVVGGRIFNDDDKAFEQVGADAAACDAREAVSVGERLVHSKYGAQT